MWSLGVAVLFHVGLLFFGPWLRADAGVFRPGGGAGGDSDVGGGTPVDVFFGPPEIFELDGTLSEDSPDRILEASRSLQMPPECLLQREVQGAPASGRVRLRVNSSGRIETATLAESTGDPCWDGVATRVAGDLWYQWLPSERFPAPVELIQPMTLVRAEK